MIQHMIMQQGWTWQKITLNIQIPTEITIIPNKGIKQKSLCHKIIQGLSCKIQPTNQPCVVSIIKLENFLKCLIWYSLFWFSFFRLLSSFLLWWAFWLLYPPGFLGCPLFIWTLKWWFNLGNHFKDLNSDG